jgi:hypothetical protein
MPGDRFIREAAPVEICPIIGMQLQGVQNFAVKLMP